MEKLSRDSLVKWRTTELAQFRQHRRFFRADSRDVGRDFAGRVVGRPPASRTAARREYSKIFRDAFARSYLFQASARRFEGFGERVGVLLDFAAARLGGADQQRVSELGVISRQVEATDDTATREFGQHRRHRPVELQHRLVKARSFKRELHAFHANQCGDELVGTAVRFVGNSRKTFRP